MPCLCKPSNQEPMPPALPSSNSQLCTTAPYQYPASTRPLEAACQSPGEFLRQSNKTYLPWLTCSFHWKPHKGSCQRSPSVNPSTPRPWLPRVAPRRACLLVSRSVSIRPSFQWLAPPDLLALPHLNGNKNLYYKTTSEKLEPKIIKKAQNE
uniref:Uncharacterized protein n=1 Tax=Molossus molossus TaxID=27622 RepID=A0A7J8IZ03_MOLMO|nr:hypothetical protein HJG59_010265 [Molossus molossus]